MLKVWGRTTSSNVQKVMWTIVELGLAHERVDVGGAFGGLDTDAYGAMNPNRVIPTLQDGELVLWESNAIVRYLAARYGAGNLWPEDPGERALVDRWMDWQQTTIHPLWRDVFFGAVRTPPEHRDHAAVAASAEHLGRSYAILDRHLAGRDFVGGGRLTMGDIPLGMTLYRYYEMEIERPGLPNVEAWYARLQERAAYRDHVMVNFDSLRNTLVPPQA